jgi:tRNA A-37 threonylcarbamoyl transferase component Bud32/tetratricopeptide (TPR) repeat protein
LNLEVERLLDLAAQVPRGRRAKFIAQQCLDPLVRAEVESLLEYATGAESFFEDAVQGVAASLRNSVEASPGDIIGAYRVVSLIGRGGMGSVYLAERIDGEIQQRVAVKLLRADGHSPVWRGRFLRERQLLASLHHPSIVHVIDAGHTADGLPFLVMEYVEGVPVDAYAAGVGVRDRLKLFLRVCEGVAHAHRHLIIHRDLKPSNILVDASGQPKLLDFGIAKLLDETGDATQTVERVLTPNYASPEQEAGDAQTTATDIYSLGAVLYKLLTGAAARRKTPGTAGGEIIPPSRVNPEVPMDVDFIVRKALRAEPEERYVSVDEFANDVRAALDWRPVQARSGDAWYRTRRFLRRYWVPALAAVLVVGSLSTGLYVANRERAIAQRRFVQVRQLSNKLFDIDAQVAQLPGGSKTRQLIVDTSLEYLRRLAADVHGDPDLALEVGNAYMRVARVQGVPTSPNLGQMDQAEASLRMAEGFIQSVLASQPENRAALLRSAQIAHDRMLLARYTARYDAAAAFARKSAGWLEKLHPGEREKAEASPILSTYSDLADQFARAEQLDEALILCRRAQGLAHSWAREDYLPDLLWVSADVLRRRSDLDQALKELDESVRLLDPGSAPAPLWREMNFALALICRGEVLGEKEAISLGRPESAVESLDRAFRLADEFVHQDPRDELARSRLANAGIPMGDILRSSDPQRALTIYDHIFLHVAEIPNNSSFRRFEVSTLVGSSYALRLLGRSAEARQKLDAAFERLNQVLLYPATSIRLGSEPAVALRALADHEADTGNLSDAAEVYRNLLDRIQASEPKPEISLTDAVRLSAIYRAAARVQRQAGEVNRAGTLEARWRELWQHWDRKLPKNTFVRRQLEADGFR